MKAAHEEKLARLKSERERQLRVLEDARKNGIKFLHTGVYTIAYRVDRRNVLEISTTIRHPNDRFSKLIGEYQAATYFFNNHRIHLRIPAGPGRSTPKKFLLSIFGFADFA